MSDTAVWVPVETVIPDAAARLAWMASDPALDVNSSCTECSPGNRSLVDSVYPMYLALDDDQGHSAWGADADTLVASYLSWKNISYRAWRRSDTGKIADARGRSLFMQGEQLRSENEIAVAGYATIEVTHDLGWQMTRENEAYPDPTSLNGLMTTFTLNGPVFLGVSATLDPATFYMGHVADVSLYRYALEGKDVDCLYRDVANGGEIAVCQAPDQMDRAAYTNDLVETAAWGRGITLGGDAFAHPELGLVFDGDGDYATIDGGWRFRRYADSGTFAVSFWVTRERQTRDPPPCDPPPCTCDPPPCTCCRCPVSPLGSAAALAAAPLF